MSLIRSVKEAIIRRWSRPSTEPETSAAAKTSTAAGETPVSKSRQNDAGHRRVRQRYVNRARHLLDFINSSHRDGRLCDLIISTQGGDLQAHRLALGSASSTLASLLSNHADGSVVRLNLTDFQLEIVAGILKYVYMAELTLDCGTIAETLACAIKLGMTDLVAKCTSYMTRTCNTNNALLHYSIAENNNLQATARRLFDFVVNNFDEISESRHLMYMSAERLERILKSNNLRVNSEVDVFDSVVRWVRFDRESRTVEGSRLLNCVRFERLTIDDFVNHVEPASWMLKDADWKNIYSGMKQLALTTASAGNSFIQKHAESKSLFSEEVPYRNHQNNNMPNMDVDDKSAERQPKPSISRSEEVTPPAAATSPSHQTNSRRLNLLSITSTPFTITNKHSINYHELTSAQTQKNLNCARYHHRSNDEEIDKKFEQPTTSVRFATQSPMKAAAVCCDAVLNDDDDFNWSQSNRSSVSTETDVWSYRSPVASSAGDGGYDIEPSARSAVDVDVDSNTVIVVASPSNPDVFDGDGSSSSSQKGDRSALDYKAAEMDLITFGGINLGMLDDGPPGRMVAGYDSTVDCWKTVTKRMASFLHHHGIAVLDDKFYVVGGCIYDSKHPSSLGVATRDVRVFDAKGGGVWHSAPAMQMCRSYLAVATWEDCIFAIGGEDETKRKLDTVECYERLTRQWTIVTRMPGGCKIGVAAATLHDHLYVVGGFADSRPVEYQIASDVERYDVAADSWCIMGTLTTPRCFAGLVNLADHLYLIGGRTRFPGTSGGEPVSIDSVDEYLERSDEWSTVAEMRVARHDVGCCGVSGKFLYIVGGMRSPKPFCTRTVECLDVSCAKWVDKIADYPLEACGIGCGSLT